MKKWMYCKNCKQVFFTEVATVNRCICGTELKGMDDPIIVGKHADLMMTDETVERSRR